MGFLKSLGNMLQGKPMFDPTQQPDQPAEYGEEQPAVPQPAPGQQTVRKVVPVVMIDHQEVRHNGSRMDVDVFIKNTSQVRILLDKIKILGSIRELDTYLRPGERKKFRVYSANRSTNSPDSRTEIWFRGDDGDYFSALHIVEFHKESDNTFGVVRIKFTPPIKDI